MRNVFNPTLSKKLILLFSAILITVILLNVFISMFLLEKVYFQNKISDMKKFYETLDQSYKSNASQEDVIVNVKSLVSNNNMRVFIWDENDRLIIDSVPILQIESATGDKIEPPPDNNRADRKKPPIHAPWHKGEFFIFNADVEKKDLIFENKDYSIIRFSNFDDMGQQSLYLRGSLPNNYKVLLQVPVLPMKEAVAISNTISLAIGLAMLIVGVIVVFITAKRIAKPVKELSDIAVSMQNLDFSRKYTGHRNDEIEALGKAINMLSEKLEITIAALKKKNDVLQKDNEMKSRIDEMRKEFIANASHELKTPIALIAGYAEGLKDNIAADEQSKNAYIDVIHDEAMRMDGIIRQMLEIMELEIANDVLNAETFSMNDLIEDVIHSCSLLAENTRTDIKYDVDDNVTVYGDYWRIYRSVLNYLTNALHHVDENKKIVLTLKDEGSKVYLGVYNSGHHIPESESEKIWEKFYKTDKAHTREYGGTGLGLSIVKTTVKLHGGECGFVNKPKGVEFYIILNKENV